jgi:hypothetical protein
VDIPLPWERLLWTGRPVRVGLRLRGERYFVTDFRLIRARGHEIDELVLHDVGDVRRFETRADRWLGTSTIVVDSRRAGIAPVALVGIRRGVPLAALVELLAGDPHAIADLDAVRAALAWNPPAQGGSYREAVGAMAAILIAVLVLLAGGLGRHAAPIAYAANDAIEPNGVKRSRADIVRFMETDVMPWARLALAPIKGGVDRVSCETCHGTQPDGRDWQMPSVAALPLPDVRDRGWEIYNARLDPQVRNAIYGYVAESDNQARAAYMREIVVPGMARLLGRPPYDFTRSYEYNRANHALGCYHCHRVK